MEKSGLTLTVPCLPGCIPSHSATGVAFYNKMFTYEWLGAPTESGIPRVLNRSISTSSNLKEAIAHAKTELKKKEFLRAGQTSGVRILNNESVLVWTRNIDDV